MAIAKSARTRWLFVCLLLAGNLIFWLIPSDVVELVAREQHVLCGRYSRVQFAWMLGVAVISVAAILIRTGATPLAIRRRVYAVVAVLMVLAPTILVADIAMRMRTQYPYMPDTNVFHRPPNQAYQQPYVDRPEAKRSYPIVPAGFGTVPCTLTYDANGYRNAGVPAQRDIVTLGDSFTEGSRVSDDQPWPVIFSKLIGRPVYNLGISGYGPPEYLASLKQFGMPLRPKTVICMLYEGNDFHSTDVEARSGVTFKQVIKTSPLLMDLDRTILRIFGPIGVHRDFRHSEILSWMPVAYPAESGGQTFLPAVAGANASSTSQQPSSAKEAPGTRYYAFEPKQLLELNVSPDDFSSSEPWFAMKGVLREMNECCQKAGATLVIAYAPNKAHVVFPLAAAGLPTEKVRAFCALRMKKIPPKAQEFVQQLVMNLESREGVIASWCAGKSIPFVSLTPTMRDYVRAGRQPYFTYDQHWSPLGHEAAARAVYEYWSSGGRETNPSIKQIAVERK